MKKFSKQPTPSCREVNGIDLVDFLRSLGHEPTRNNPPDYWYRSPLREERTASFKVQRKKNLWFDFGIQQGGSLIDFCTRYFSCTVAEVLEKFLSQQISPANVSHENPQPASDQSRALSILSTHPLTNTSLMQYLYSRRIDPGVAQKNCCQAFYEVAGKAYYSIAFLNNSGGYELRNKYSKLSSSPKDCTFLDNQGFLLCVFEGFFDFLSFLTIHKNLPIPPANFLILNTVAFLEQCRPGIEKHATTLLYLDNDKAGDEATAKALSWSPHIHDQRALYRGYKDVNEWLCYIGHKGHKGLFNQL